MVSVSGRLIKPCCINLSIFSAPTASSPAEGSKVAVPEVYATFARILSAKYRVPLPDRPNGHAFAFEL